MLGENDVAVLVGDPAGGQLQAELGRGQFRQIGHAQEIFAEGVAPVGQVGEGPENHFAVGQNSSGFVARPSGNSDGCKSSGGCGISATPPGAMTESAHGVTSSGSLARVRQQMRDPHHLVVQQFHAHRFLETERLARRLGDLHRRFAESFFHVTGSLSSS